MFDKKHAAPQVGVGSHEIFKGLDETHVRGFIVRVDGAAKNAAIDTLARAGDSGISLRSKGRCVD